MTDEKPPLTYTEEQLRNAPPQFFDELRRAALQEQLDAEERELAAEMRAHHVPTAKAKDADEGVQATENVVGRPRFELGTIGLKVRGEGEVCAQSAQERESDGAFAHSDDAVAHHVPTEAECFKLQAQVERLTEKLAARSKGGHVLAARSKGGHVLVRCQCGGVGCEACLDRGVVWDDGEPMRPCPGTNDGVACGRWLNFCPGCGRGVDNLGEPTEVERLTAAIRSAHTAIEDAEYFAARDGLDSALTDGGHDGCSYDYEAPPLRVKVERLRAERDEERAAVTALAAVLEKSIAGLNPIGLPSVISNAAALLRKIGGE